MKRIVVALGGNAILTEDPSAKAQQRTLEETARHLIELIVKGHEVVISHGNGPQVGNLVLQQQAADSRKNPAMPLDTCVAMTQGSIGYWMQQAINNALIQRDIKKRAMAVITQVEVSPEDPSFQHPTKPIGPFLSEEAARVKMEEETHLYVEDAGRGWRKVVPSPKPIGILQKEEINQLIAAGTVTICSGGGGVPVVQTKDGYQGIEAVIDKDFASCQMAQEIHADQLIILTGVDNVYINFNQPNQEKLERITAERLQTLVEEGHFAPGSMLPKVEAAIAFVNSGDNREAVITSLEQLKHLDEGAGTVIYR
ncbi:carbamate kinase [Fusibacter bizertensis]